MLLAVFSFSNSPARVIDLPYNSLFEIPDVVDIPELNRVVGWDSCELIEILDGSVTDHYRIRHNWYQCRRYLSGLIPHLYKALPLLDLNMEGDLLYVSNASGSISFRISVALFYQDDPDYSAITEAILHRILHHITGAHTHVEDGKLQVKEEPTE